MSWWNPISWFRKVAVAIYTVAMPTVKSTVYEIINDPEVQAAAKDAVKAARDKGLNGNEAMDAAIDILKGKGVAAGKSAATTIIKTVIQNVYCAEKCTEE